MRPWKLPMLSSRGFQIQSRTVLIIRGVGVRLNRVAYILFVVDDLPARGKADRLRERARHAHGQGRDRKVKGWAALGQKEWKPGYQQAKGENCRGSFQQPAEKQEQVDLPGGWDVEH